MNRPTLTTERLILRPFVAADAPEVSRLAGDRRVADTTLNIPHPYDESMALGWIGTHADAAERDEALTLAITDRETGRLVGAVALATSSAQGRAELGYWVGVDYWGRGFATEASRALVNHAFTTLGLRRVVAHCLTRNEGSWRVMEKLGMTREGHLRQHVVKWDVAEDIWLYGVLRDEWKALRNAADPCT